MKTTTETWILPLNAHQKEATHTEESLSFSFTFTLHFSYLILLSSPRQELARSMRCDVMRFIPIQMYNIFARSFTIKLIQLLFSTCFFSRCRSFSLCVSFHQFIQMAGVELEVKMSFEIKQKKISIVLSDEWNLCRNFISNSAGAIKWNEMNHLGVFLFYMQSRAHSKQHILEWFGCCRVGSMVSGLNAHCSNDSKKYIIQIFRTIRCRCVSVNGIICTYEQRK